MSKLLTNNELWKVLLLVCASLDLVDSVTAMNVVHDNHVSEHAQDADVGDGGTAQTAAVGASHFCLGSTFHGRKLSLSKMWNDDRTLTF